MKVLLANNYLHTVPGGGEVLFLQTQALLRQRGHQVVPSRSVRIGVLDSEWRPYFPTQREVPLRPRVSNVYARHAKKRLKTLLTATKPNVAHLHNVFEKLTLSVVDALAQIEVPAVMTLHDYRMVGPNYRLLTHDGIRHRCLNSNNYFMRLCIAPRRGHRTKAHRRHSRTT